MTDIAAGWTECKANWGKDAPSVRKALKRLKTDSLLSSKLFTLFEIMAPDLSTKMSLVGFVIMIELKHFPTTEAGLTEKMTRAM